MYTTFASRFDLLTKVTHPAVTHCGFLKSFGTILAPHHYLFTFTTVLDKIQSKYRCVITVLHISGYQTVSSSQLTINNEAVTVQAYLCLCCNHCCIRIVPIFVVFMVAESFEQHLVKPIDAVIDIVGTGYYITCQLSGLVDSFSG